MYTTRLNLTIKIDGSPDDDALPDGCALYWYVDQLAPQPPSARKAHP